MKSKQFLAAALSAAVCLPALTIGAAAVTAPVQYGDAKFDGIVNIADVTALQRYLAGLEGFDEYQKVLADFDHDGSITINDATWIQKYLAEMWIPEEYGGWAQTYVSTGSFYADYDSGKAVPNRPVTFTTQVYDSGNTFAFYVDGMPVQARSADNSMTYAFPAAGEYNVGVRVYNSDGFYHSMNVRYRVVEAYDYNTLSIVACHMLNPNSTEQTLEMQAAGGAAPYAYSVKLYAIDWMTGDTAGLSDDDIEMFGQYVQTTGDDAWQLCYDEKGAYLYHDFTDDSTVAVSGFMLGGYVYQAEVCAADSLGGYSAPETIQLYLELSVG